MDHQWAEVLFRRWCISCEAYQTRRSSTGQWQPQAPPECPATTPFGRELLLSGRGDVLAE